MRSTQELILDALRKSGEKIDGTSEYTSDALTYMNDFYKAILSGGNEFDVDLAEPWIWAKAKNPGILTLLPPYSSGTVAVTNGSLSGTFASPPADSQEGCYLKISDRPEFFRIAQHTAGSPNFTLDGIYTDDTAPAISFKCLRTDYQLDAGSILRLIGAMEVYKIQVEGGNDDGKIDGFDPISFSRTNPKHRIQEGVPTQFTAFYNTDGTIYVRFNKYVATQTRVEYNYIPVPADLTNDSTSIPLLPESFEKVLSYATAYALNKDKEDDKAEHFFEMAQRKLKSLVQANRKSVSQTTDKYAKLFARPDTMNPRKMRFGDGY